MRHGPVDGTYSHTVCNLYLSRSDVVVPRWQWHYAISRCRRRMTAMSVYGCVYLWDATWIAKSHRNSLLKERVGPSITQTCYWRIGCWMLYSFMPGLTQRKLYYLTVNRKKRRWHPIPNLWHFNSFFRFVIQYLQYFECFHSASIGLRPQRQLWIHAGNVRKLIVLLATLAKMSCCWESFKNI